MEGLILKTQIDESPIAKVNQKGGSLTVIYSSSIISETAIPILVTQLRLLISDKHHLELLRYCCHTNSNVAFHGTAPMMRICHCGRPWRMIQALKLHMGWFCGSWSGIERTMTSVERQIGNMRRLSRHVFVLNLSPNYNAVFDSSTSQVFLPVKQVSRSKSIPNYFQSPNQEHS